MESQTDDPASDYIEYLSKEMSSNHSSEVTPIMQLIISSANRYVLPFVIVAGFVGNLFSFLVFMFSRLKSISTSVYLAALAVSDSGFLICVGIGWFDNMGIRFFHSNGVCQILVYATYVFGFTSVWFVNAFTAEMYISVFHPQKSTSISSISCARKVVCALSGFSALFYIFSFWTARVVEQADGKETCAPHPNDTETMMVLSILDTVLTLLIPFSMIIFMISRLLVDITRLYNKGSEHTDTPSSSESESMRNSHSETNTSTVTSIRQATKAQSKLKQMLVVVVLVFLVLNLPSHVIRLQFFFRSISDSSYTTTTTEIYLQQIFLFIYYVNFAINVVLYSACAKSFRKALCKITIISCKHDCKSIKNCFIRLTSFRFRKGKDTETSRSEEQEAHSRLVEIHLSEIRLSQIPSFDTEYICQSPPCLISGNTENTNI